MDAVTALNGAYRQLGGTTQELASKMEHNLRQTATSTDYQNRLACFWNFGDSRAQSLQHPNSTTSCSASTRSLRTWTGKAQGWSRKQPAQ